MYNTKSTICSQCLSESLLFLTRAVSHVVECQKGGLSEVQLTPKNKSSNKSIK